MARHLKVVEPTYAVRGASDLPLPPAWLTYSLGVAGQPPKRSLALTGGHVKTTCSDGRCPQPVSLDREAELQGLCYFHSKVKAGLIVDVYEGPTYDDEGHQVIAGELVPVSLP